MSVGRAPSGQALAVPATPASAVDGPSGFDPSRSAIAPYRDGLCDTGCNALSICACSAIEELAEEVDALRHIISELGYCTPHASLDFMRLIPNEVKAARRPSYYPPRFTESQMVPRTVEGVLEQIWCIADNYDLREAIEAHPVHKDSTFDSFMWRDCMEVINAIATEARRAETENTGSVHEGAGRNADAPENKAVDPYALGGGK